METCASDLSSECLVTDLVHELSSGLEIPFLLSDDIKTNKLDSISPLDNILQEEPVKEEWTDDVYFNFLNNYKSNFFTKEEISDDIQSYFDKNDIVQTHSNNGFSGSGSGSGSECSSTEIWVTKNELDTPPVTPPDERVSPESVLLLSDELRFTPIGVEENIQSDLQKVNVSSLGRKVRIQPKPVTTTLNIFDSQPQRIQTVMCNVFSDVNLNNIKKLEPNIFLDLTNDRKKSVLSKKDLELLQAKRKQERMIRNRESAYLSRKRKKEHVAYLEKQVQDLVNENSQLKMENRSLRQRLAKYEEVELLPIVKKSRRVFPESQRKATALLALLLTVCLNIGSFSSFINERRGFSGENEIDNENIVPLYSNEIKHTRSLLWTETDFEGFNSTLVNLNKTSCPVYINQTESIRLESELRRWIGGDEDYSRQSKRNISKISQYFYSGDKPTKLKNISKRKFKHSSRNLNKKGSLEMNMYQMKSNLFNFDTFFEAIHRRDDTFYLVSFSSDHLLLPALSHNKTSRPKMSLMLPAFLSNATGADQVEMMQIDCEVTNTQLLSVNENDIPSHMRPYYNSTSRTKNAPESKSDSLEQFFVSDLPGALVPDSKPNSEFNIKNNSTVKRNNQKSGIVKFEEPRYKFNATNGAQSPSNIFSKNSYNENSEDLDSGNRNGKNLLKMLMVGPTNAKFLDIKYTKSKNYYNSTN